MKKLILYSGLFVISVLLSSCGVGAALVTNLNQNATEVHLSTNNFKVIDQVSGSSEASYILAIGGCKQKAIISKCLFDDDDE